jgi:hypothetical protein
MKLLGYDEGRERGQVVPVIHRPRANWSMIDDDATVEIHRKILGGTHPCECDICVTVRGGHPLTTSPPSGPPLPPDPFEPFNGKNPFDEPAQPEAKKCYYCAAWTGQLSTAGIPTCAPCLRRYRKVEPVAETSSTFKGIERVIDESVSTLQGMRLTARAIADETTEQRLIRTVKRMFGKNYVP